MKRCVIVGAGPAGLSAAEVLAAAIESARINANDAAGALWITRDEGFHWFSTFNQARLALEAQFHFGPSEIIDPVSLPPAKQSALLRSRFYTIIQSMLLEHVLM